MTLGELVLASVAGLDETSAALLELEQAELVVRSGAWFERARVVPLPPGSRRER